MTVHQLKESLELTVLVEQEIDKEITGCYIGDLLSWAMSRIKTGDVWLTVMGNVNAIAVAVLSDAACIILTDAAALDEEAKEKAQQQGITVFSSNSNSYQVAVQLSRLLSECNEYTMTCICTLVYLPVEARI